MSGDTLVMCCGQADGLYYNEIAIGTTLHLRDSNRSEFAHQARLDILNAATTCFASPPLPHPLALSFAMSAHITLNDDISTLHATMHVLHSTLMLHMQLRMSTSTATDPVATGATGPRGLCAHLHPLAACMQIGLGALISYLPAVTCQR